MQAMLGTFLPDFKIHGLTPDGRAFGIYQDIKVFVEKGVPGDIADVQMVRSFPRDKTLATGKIISLKKSSPLRIDSFCKHFNYCGGCQWQNINYVDQLKFKQQQVEQLFLKTGETNFEMMPVLPSPQQKYFRNRITFTFSNRRWMSPDELKDENTDRHPAGGFVLKGNNDRIMNIEECFLTDDYSVTVMKALREFAIQNEYPFYDVRHEKGFLRTLTIRFGDGVEAMAIVGFAVDEKEKIDTVMNYLRVNFPRLSSLFYTIRPGKDGMRNEALHIHFAGKKSIEYKMENLNFRTGPTSFYQTNTLQAVELYKTARSFAALTGEENIYDLYTGTGTIAMFVAHLAKKVVGIDSAAEAIEDAKVNAAINKIYNTTFVSGDLKDTLTQDFIMQHGKPDVIITDPPRGGMHRDGIKRLLESGAERIVYISCNPVTQVRDIRNLSLQYKLVKCQPVDMFPQTSHVENVVLLERRLTN
ncbi:MAG: 23S rRNA (uracil(1939)-C(5))-methyltransferase RlmD [Bacteroidota bacterium]